MLLWLLVLVVSPATSIYWSHIRESANETVLRESGREYRDGGANWRQYPIRRQDKKEEAPEISMVHYLRLFGCCLIMAQFTYILHLGLRVFIPNYIQEDSSSDENVMQLVDLPGLMRKGKLNKSKKSKKTPKKNGQSSKNRPQTTLQKLVEQAKTPKIADDLVTAIDKSAKKKKVTKTVRSEKPKPKPEKEKSQRLPRAEKGHQTKLLDDMDNFMLGEEAAAIEAGVREPLEKVKKSEQRLPRVEEMNTASDKDERKSPDLMKSKDV